jgi:hypothetical protein
MARGDCSKLVTPTPERVEAALKQFNDANAVGEKALGELFKQYPSNGDLHHVFLKVVALNFLYSTRILLHSTKVRDVGDVADHIYRIHRDIDAALNAHAPNPEIVDRIAKIPVIGKRDIGCFSFATKYCSWHEPKSYPIWDSNVELYLQCLQKQTDFGDDFKLKGDWKYSDFLGVMTRLSKRYGLDSFTFKDIDKFLWSEGERLKNSGKQI